MSVTPGLGAFNKDKVANKFGIQLKAKDTKKPSQRLLNTSTEQKPSDTKASIITENKTVSDFCLQNELNGFKSNKNILNQSPSSQTLQPIRKSLENSKKSKSTIGIASTITLDEQINHSNSNVNHSKSENLVKPNELTNSVYPSSSPSSSNISLPSESFNSLKRSSLTPVNNDRRTIAASTGRNKSLEPLSVKQTSVTIITEQPTLPTSSTQQSSIKTMTTKTEAEIEHQKDQPLYKRQLSKTLDNSTPITNKNRHQHEHSTSSPTMTKR